MIKLIVGNKGSGKTKALIEDANAQAKNANGDIVCIEKGLKLTYDLNHNVRLIDVDNYPISTYEEFYGFIAGILACNYDITHIYIDGTFKVVGKNGDQFMNMIEKLDKIVKEDIHVLFTASCDISELPKTYKKYI